MYVCTSALPHVDESSNKTDGRRLGGHCRRVRAGHAAPPLHRREEGQPRGVPHVRPDIEWVLLTHYACGRSVGRCRLSCVLSFLGGIRLIESIRPLLCLPPNREICTALARAATALLHAERYESPWCTLLYAQQNDRINTNTHTPLPQQPTTNIPKSYDTSHSVVVYAVERGEGREVKEAFASDGQPRAADTDDVRIVYTIIRSCGCSCEQNKSVVGGCM